MDDSSSPSSGYDFIEKDELLMSENDEPYTPPPSAVAETKPSFEFATQQNITSKPKRPTKIGYGGVDDMPAQHIRLFAPWMFDMSTNIVQFYQNVISKYGLQWTRVHADLLMLRAQNNADSRFGKVI